MSAATGEDNITRNFMISTEYSADEMKRNEMGGHVARMGEGDVHTGD